MDWFQKDLRYGAGLLNDWSYENEIADNIVNLFKSSKETWETELTACNESLGQVDIKREIFQKDNFLPLLFVVVLIPLLTTWIRRTSDM